MRSKGKPGGVTRRDGGPTTAEVVLHHSRLPRGGHPEIQDPQPRRAHRCQRLVLAEQGLGAGHASLLVCHSWQMEDIPLPSLYRERARAQGQNWAEGARLAGGAGSLDPGSAAAASVLLTLHFPAGCVWRMITNKHSETKANKRRKRH